MAFDYIRYKQQFREAALKRGIDPEEGSPVGNAYVVANAKAEGRKRRAIQAVDRGWWKNGELWAEWQTTERVDRSQTEDIVFRLMVVNTRTHKTDYIGQIVADILREIYHRDEPLSALRQRTGGNQVWRTEVHRGKEKWVRYIDPIPRVVPVA